MATLLWYAIGRLLGEARVTAAINRYGPYILFRIRTYERLVGSYRRNNFVVTLIGQTIPVARVYLALPAGVLALRPTLFLTAAAIGILLYNSSMLVLGFALNETGWSPITLALAVSLALIIAEVTIALALARWRARKLKKEIPFRMVSPDIRRGSPDAVAPDSWCASNTPGIRELSKPSTPHLKTR